MRGTFSARGRAPPPLSAEALRRCKPPCWPSHRRNLITAARAIYNRAITDSRLLNNRDRGATTPLLRLNYGNDPQR